MKNALPLPKRYYLTVELLEARRVPSISPLFLEQPSDPDIISPELVEVVNQAIVSTDEPVIEVVHLVEPLPEPIVDPVIDPISEVVEPVLEADPVPSPLVQVIDPAVAAIDPVVDPIVEAAGHVLDPIVEAIDLVVDPIVDVVDPVLGPIVEVIDPVVDPIVDVVNPIVEVIDPVVDPIVQLVDPVLDPIVEVIDPVVDPIVELVDPILDPIVEVIDPVMDPIVDVVDPVDEVIDPVMDPIIDVVDPVDPIIDVADPVDEVIDSVIDVDPVDPMVEPDDLEIVNELPADPLAEGTEEQESAEVEPNLPDIDSIWDLVTETLEPVIEAAGSNPNTPAESPGQVPGELNGLEGQETSRLNSGDMGEEGLSTLDLIVFVVLGQILDMDGGSGSDDSAPPVEIDSDPSLAAVDNAAAAGEAMEETEEAPEPESISVLADCSPFDTTALETSMAHLLNQLANLRQELLAMLANLGIYPWVFALAALAVSYEYRRRRRKAQSEWAGMGELPWMLGLGDLACVG